MNATTTVVSRSTRSPGAGMPTDVAGRAEHGGSGTFDPEELLN